MTVSSQPPITDTGRLELLTKNEIAFAMQESVAVLGASPDTGRYSNMAINALLTAGYLPVPVNPKYDEVNNLPCYPDLASCPRPLEQVTVYLSPSNLQPLITQIIDLNPDRVIFNPGSESAEAKTRFEEAGILVEYACTLVLLSTNQFQN